MVTVDVHYDNDTNEYHVEEVCYDDLIDCYERSREQMEQDIAGWRADMLAQGLNPDEEDIELPF